MFSRDILDSFNTGVGLVGADPQAAALLERVLLMMRANSSHPRIRQFDHQGALELLFEEQEVGRYIALLDATLFNPFPTSSCQSCELESSNVRCWNAAHSWRMGVQEGIVPCRDCFDYWRHGAWLVHFAGPNKGTCLERWVRPPPNPLVAATIHSINRTARRRARSLR
eukprot:2245428-Prymnesium_polylepis.1